MALTLGPYLGEATPSSLVVWGRLDLTGSVAVSWAPDGLPAVVGTTPPRCVGAETDYTFAIHVEGLEAATVYFIEVQVDGVPAGAVLTRTAPPYGDPGEVTLAMVSDAFPGPSTVWAAVASRAPHLAFTAGDVDHSNWATNTSTAAGALAKARAMHRRYRGPETPFGADLVANIRPLGVPLLAIMDDHDSGNDNVGDQFKWWASSLQAFAEYHPPAADNGLADGYMDSATRWGSVHVILVDTRTHRHKVGASKTLLGDAQKARLVERLTRSATDPTIRWTVLLTPVPMNPNQHKLDSWSGFPADRAWLEAQVVELGVKNLLVWSGDLHWGSIALPPLVVLPEVSNPKAGEGFANTGNNAADQWSLNSTAPGTGFSTLTFRPEAVVMALYNADGSLRFGVTWPAVP